MSQPEPDPLDAVIARTEGAIRLVPAVEAWPWRFARCWMLATKVEDHGGGMAEMDAALAEFHLLPIDVPSRAKLAAVVANGQLRRGILHDYDRVRQAVALADIANEDPTPLPGWPKTDAALRSMLVLHRLTRGTGQLSPRDGLAEIERHAGLVAGEEPYATIIELARIHARYLNVLADRDFAGMEEVADSAEQLRRRHGANPPNGPNLEVMAESLRVIFSLYRGDASTAAVGLERLTDRVAAVPPGPSRASAENMVANLRASLNILQAGIGVGVGAGASPAAWGLSGAPSTRVSPEDLAYFENAANRPGAAAAERTAHQTVLALAHLIDGDGRSADEAIESLRAAVANAPPGDPHRPEYLMTLGYALCDRYEQFREPADLEESITTLVQSRSLAGSPAHPHWANCSKTLSHAYRLAGRRKQSRAIGLDGLRGNVWSVLLQADPVAGTNAGRDAAEDAIDVARWCLEDDDVSAALTALEAGRGLMLFAATEHRAVTDRLVERGEISLAERWRATIGPGSVSRAPIELRQEVFGALAGFTRDTPIPLLEPPGQPEIQRALRTLDLDALVYLMPGDNGSGAAVIVPADGAARQVWLPRLHREHMPDLRRIGPEAPARGDDGRRDASVRTMRELDQVYTWAWQAVVAPVLDSVPGTDGRPPRIALIPMRELALVPWHAARYPDLDGPGYAVEKAMFSYPLSARLLCEAAAAKPVLLNDMGLFVGDPDTGGHAVDLPAARAEALAIRDRYYPAATYVGRAADGSPSPISPGRPEDILNWLADPSGGTVLHLACHGVVEPASGIGNPDPGGTGRTDSAYLLLSRGARLAAERIIGTSTGGGGRPVGLVVLAACHSGVAARGGQDEAFSLAATFRVSGARTVISSQWSVPDGATSLLMFMFHHELRSGRGPLEALHRAQLWMIARDRQPPDTMPAALRAHLAHTDPSDVDAWAGFIHIGR
jgi:CHAT domain-containing protein